MGLKCHRCGSANTANPHPPRFSPDDKYLRYRIREKYKQSGRPYSD
ncbi:MAG TPA: nucleolar RNA-binding Nop10p family protein [Nitrososphaerales archaeon]|nr:nucleolar RNA-binding Nop10p family protein [Nitrososphaerales archaeon]